MTSLTKKKKKSEIVVHVLYSQRHPRTRKP